MVFPPHLTWIGANIYESSIVKKKKKKSGRLLPVIFLIILSSLGMTNDIPSILSDQVELKLINFDNNINIIIKILLLFVIRQERSMIFLYHEQLEKN